MEPNIWPNVNGLMNGGLNVPPNGLMPFQMNGSMNAPMNNLMNDAMNELMKDPDAEKNREMMNRERIRKAILGDIHRANDFYASKIEPVLRQRHQIYEADRAYYKKRFPEVSKQSDFVSFDFWSLVQWAIPSVMNSFF